MGYPGSVGTFARRVVSAASRGLPYGGLQEGGGNDKTHHDYGISGYLIGEWQSRVRQTWSATGFLRMIFQGLMGMGFSPEGISFAPLLPEGYTHVRLSFLPYRDMLLDIHLTGSGRKVAQFKINGEVSAEPFLPATGKGQINVHITMGS